MHQCNRTSLCVYNAEQACLTAGHSCPSSMPVTIGNTLLLHCLVCQLFFRLGCKSDAWPCNGPYWFCQGPLYRAVSTLQSEKLIGLRHTEACNANSQVHSCCTPRSLTAGKSRCAADLVPLCLPASRSSATILLCSPHRRIASAGWPEQHHKRRTKPSHPGSGTLLGAAAWELMLPHMPGHLQQPALAHTCTMAASLLYPRSGRMQCTMSSLRERRRVRGRSHLTKTCQLGKYAHPASQAKCWRRILQLFSAARCSCAQRRPTP